ncbi:glycoprotein 3-alpha-L-fucosyltransferase A [Aplysia californica]|uniref:Fucosyltransferase n=1 Tax=Aplysia californica TaxID=6500 RepID=A0ABM1A6T2_APLCA|nr:glycoprotein 3-alpha-L-fucosyltransferase A [Aplysia californica]
MLYRMNLKIPFKGVRMRVVFLSIVAIFCISVIFLNVKQFRQEGTSQDIEDAYRATLMRMDYLDILEAREEQDLDSRDSKTDQSYKVKSDRNGEKEEDFVEEKGNSDFVPSLGLSHKGGHVSVLDDKGSRVVELLGGISWQEYSATEKSESELSVGNIEKGGRKVIKGEEGTMAGNDEKIHHAVDVYDTSRADTDRILEQINFGPKRTNTSHVYTIKTGEGMGVPEGRQKFLDDGCQFTNCKVVSSGSNENRTDAVLFRAHDLLAMSDLMRFRRPDDVWIFYELESPLVTFIPDKADGLLNWTATYRRDSTIVAPYERWLPFPNASLVWETGEDGLWKERRTAVLETKGTPLKNYAEGKTKLAAVIMSNCAPRNDRLQYIHKLQLTFVKFQEYVQVDMFGRCGTSKCDGDCFQMIRSHYKFYLAFENANCHDYISEKMFINALSYDAVPVVLGARPSDYRRSAPPLSYIHVDDFPSMKALADYLTMLDRNDTLYNEYFRYKGTGSFIDTKFWCRLCAMLNDLDKPRLQIPSLMEWWSKEQCLPHGRAWDTNFPSDITYFN